MIDMGLADRNSNRRQSAGRSMLTTLLITATVATAQTLPIATTQMLPQTANRQTPADYALGPDDQIIVHVEESEEFTPLPIRIDPKGNINLPMLGRVHAAGLTTDQFENFLQTALKRYLRDPEVFVTLLTLRPQPVSVLGAVANPGVHQLEGRKTLFEVLSLAGGLRPDAGYSVHITRRLEWGRIPLPNAKDDPTGHFSLASLDVKNIMDATHPEQNIPIQPDDVITVPKADIVYVIGAVRKPGGFVLGESETLSALQVLSLSEGLDRFADTQHAKIIRAVPGAKTRAEIPVDLKQLIAGKGTDVPVRANDILFIPTSNKKAATVRGIEAALGMGTAIGTGLVIYR